VFFFRSGRNYGNRSYFPRHDRQLGAEEVLGAFLGQFYDDKTPPTHVFLSHDIGELALVAAALARRAGRRVEIARPRRGAKRKLVAHALGNAEAALARRLSESASQRRLLAGVADVFGLDGPPDRIEVYDNSHFSGDKAVGAMIVAGPEGLMKTAYRKFNIKGLKRPAGPGPDPGGPSGGPGHDPGGGPAAEGITPGDDYGMMRQVLTRRFSRALKEDPGRDGDTWPDLVLIDGGRGQLNTARDVLTDLGIADIDIVGIAKGPDRDAGRERFFLPGREPVVLDAKDPVLYFLQRLRDEAHRFAVGAHRTRRSGAIGRSVLDQIPGVGARRKRALLHRFGSARGVGQAGLADLESVDGISRTVARKIYDHFHEEG
jgi:excinuclease ABC subunit C